MGTIQGYETEEQRRSHIQALLRERYAAEVAAQNARARDDENTEKEVKAAEEAIKAVDGQLEIFGHRSRKPQAAAEKRPAPAAEQR